MPSSSSPAQHRRRQLRGRKPLDRTGSSFFGSLKSLVTAPLSWFSGAEEFEESQDVQGKRRRVATAPTERMVDDDEGPPRNKRLRRESPIRPSFQASPAVTGYNDPPASAFRSQLQPSNPSAPRSASVSFPVSSSKSYGSLGQSKRIGVPPRNTSIDPPARVPSTSFGLRGDGSMDVSAFNRITVRDTSLPPVPGRSFIMRTSMTPQPQPREVSEPPSLSTLAHNPTFVRAPSQQRIVPPQGITRQSSITLGTLAESVRSTKSPTRQHSSLFPVEASRSSEPPRSGTTIEKALHDLDIYKTPLIPTRLRASRTPATMASDMFKSKRKSLILMQDERSARGKGKKGKEEDIVTNDTKPYAGRGGMKKLLARRKQEAEELREKDVEDADQDMEQDEEPAKPADLKLAAAVSNNVRLPSPPAPTASSLFEPKSAASSGSSLRVGRSRQRNHIARPAVRPSKMKFSAIYDEDDDNMEDDEEEAARKKEHEELEAAAKRAPAFSFPEGFSFAKPESSTIKHDTTLAKEPPLDSLPFSLFKPAAPASANGGASSAEVKLDTKTTPTASAPSTSATPFSFEKPASLSNISTPAAIPTLAAAPATGGVPNFFAKSSIFSKPLDVAQPPPLMFSSIPSVSITPAAASEPENPASEAELKAASSDFFSKPSQNVPPQPTLSFGSGSTASATPAATDATVQPPKQLFPQTTPGFSFSQNKENHVSPAATPGFSFAATTTPSETKPPSLFGDAPKSTSIFGAQPPALTVTSTAPEVAPISTTQPITPTPAFSFGQPPPKTSSAEVPKSSGFTGFSFGSAAPSTSAPTSSAPSPLFGDEGKSKPAFEGGFQFGAPKKAESKPSSSPFNFGAAPSTPPIAEKKPAFSFGSASTTPTAPPPISFSFSAGSTGSTDGVNPFSFGQLPTPAPVERPVTPPRNQDQEVNMDESPVREIQPQSKPFGGPSLNGGGFSFNSQTNGTSNGFSFSGSSASNPFAQNDKPAGSTLFGTSGPGLGQASNSTSTGFSFGQTAPNDAANSRPSTGFSFGSSAPAEPPKVSAPFSFGGPSNNSSGGGFGQASGSAPNSPSTFNQSSPFTFGAPLPPVQTSFSFGSSQPASPATSTSGLPQPAFGGGGFGQSQPSPAAASSAGALFTMGSSAQPAPGASGSRQIKKLPNRRGGKR